MDPWCRTTLPAAGILLNCCCATRAGDATSHQKMQSNRLSSQEHLQTHLLSTELNPILGKITRNTFRFQFCHLSATLSALLFHSMPWHTHLFSGVDEGCFDQSMTHACNLCCLLAGVASIIAASGLSCKELCHTSMWEGMGVFSFLHYKYIVRCHPTE